MYLFYYRSPSYKSSSTNQTASCNPLLFPWARATMGVDYVEDTAPLYTLEETKILDGDGKIHDLGDVVGLCVRFMRSQTT